MLGVVVAMGLLFQAAPPPSPPADTTTRDVGDQSCGPKAHRHVMDLDEHGHYVVNHEKGEPDIVFDGLCHDNDSEALIKDPARKVLPVPKPVPQDEL